MLWCLSRLKNIESKCSRNGHEKKLFQLEVQSIKVCSSALKNMKKKMKTEIHGMMEKK